MGFGGQKDVQFNPKTGRYEFEEEETGNVKPGRGGQILGGLASLITGVPFVGSAVGSVIDRFKPKSYMQKQTPEELSRMRGLQMIDGQLIDTRMLDFNPNAKINQNTSGVDNSLSLNNFNRQIPEEEIDIQETFQPSYSGGITNTDSFTSSDGLGMYDGS